MTGGVERSQVDILRDIDEAYRNACFEARCDGAEIKRERVANAITAAVERGERDPRRLKAAGVSAALTGQHP